MGPLDLLALQKNVTTLQADVADLLERFDVLNSHTEDRFNLVLKGSEATLDRLEKLEAWMDSVRDHLAEVVAPNQREITERLDQFYDRLEAVVTAGQERNRRLDLIEADVIDRAEETHRRITALVNSQATKTETLTSEIQVLTDRVAAWGSKWGTLETRVDLQDAAMDELGVATANLLDVTVTHDADLDRAVKLGADTATEVVRVQEAIDRIAKLGAEVESDISGLQDFQNEERAESEALQKRIDDLESSNVLAVEVAERHGNSIELLEKISRRAGL